MGRGPGHTRFRSHQLPRPQHPTCSLPRCLPSNPGSWLDTPPSPHLQPHQGAHPLRLEPFPPPPPRLLPLLLRLLQQLIHSCGRASAMREALPPAAGGRENAGGDGPSPAAGCGAGRTRAAGLETAGGGWGFRTAAPPPCEDPGRSGRRPGCTPPAPSLTGALCEVGGAQQSKWPRGRGLAFLPWWPTVHHRPEARRVPGRVCSSLFFFFPLFFCFCCFC